MDIEIEDIRDNRIYEINELGQYELKTQDLSKGNNGKAAIPELDAVVAEVKKTFEETGLESVPSPWLEPLGEFISQDEYESVNVEKEWAKFEQNQVVEQLDMVVGLTDEPQNQAQNKLTMNVRDGHIGVFGAGGFGKTIMLQNMIMSLARKNTPEAIHFYLLDFGQALLPLQPLPHIADLITLDEEEKIGKWIRLMSDLIKTRKRLFKEAGVADVETYRQLTGKSLNRIIIVLDNYDAARDAELGEEFDKILTALTREGLGLGVHVIISALRGLKYQLMANIKEKITYFQIDASDVPGIMGRTQMKIPEIPGRGLVKLDDIYEFQTFVPNNKETQGERIAALREEATMMREMWKGEVPQDIPVVPEVLTLSTFKSYKTVQEVMKQPNMASVGVDLEKVESVTINFKETPLVQVLGNQTQVATTFMTIAETLIDNTEVYVIDSNRNDKLKKIKNIKKIAYTADQWFDILQPSMRQCLDALEKYEKEKIENSSVSMFDYTKDLPSRIIFISNVEIFIDGLNPAVQKQFVKIFELADVLNLMFIFGSEVANYNKVYGDLADIIKAIPLIIAFSKVGDIPRLSVDQNTYREPLLDREEANVIRNKHFIKIKTIGG